MVQIEENKIPSEGNLILKKKNLENPKCTHSTRDTTMNKPEKKSLSLGRLHSGGPMSGILIMDTKQQEAITSSCAGRPSITEDLCSHMKDGFDWEGNVEGWEFHSRRSDM